jgi:6,7-dimethyl-8-ribityllumazine synthase
MKPIPATTALGRPPALDARGLRVAVVSARFNDVIVAQLLEGARAAWERHGGLAESLDEYRVPGAFELPLACEALARTGRHADYVAGECARGLMNAGLATGIPVIFGVLTVENRAQAEERADPGRMNKGGEALEAALEMAQLLAGLRT